MKFLSYYYRAVVGKTWTKILVAVAMNVKMVLSALDKDDMTKGFGGRELLKIVVAVSADVYLTDTLTLDMKLWKKATSCLCGDI